VLLQNSNMKASCTVFMLWILKQTAGMGCRREIPEESLSGNIIGNYAE